MFGSFAPDSKPRRPHRRAPKIYEPPSSPFAERPYTAFAGGSGGEEYKSRLPSNTIKGMKVLWRQSQMAQSLRGPNRDGQMPVEALSDTSDSSENSSPNIFDNKQRTGKPKSRQKKVAGVSVIKKDTERVVKTADLSAISQEANVVVEKKKEVAEVAVQAMRPASIDALTEGRLNMLESRLRLEEMRSKSWCVRMTEAEESVKQLQAQVKALSADAMGTGAQNRFTLNPPRERGLWPVNSVEGRKTQKLGAKASQIVGKDFTSELNAILMQIRKDNESEEMMGDYSIDSKK